MQVKGRVEGEGRRSGREEENMRDQGKLSWGKDKKGEQ